LAWRREPQLPSVLLIELDLMALQELDELLITMPPQRG